MFTILRCHTPHARLVGRTTPRRIHPHHGSKFSPVNPNTVYKTRKSTKNHRKPEKQKCFVDSHTQSNINRRSNERGIIKPIRPSHQRVTSVKICIEIPSAIISVCVTTKSYQRNRQSISKTPARDYFATVLWYLLPSYQQHRAA